VSRPPRTRTDRSRNLRAGIAVLVLLVPPAHAGRTDEIDDETSHDALVRALADPDPKVRWRAAFRLRLLPERSRAARTALFFALEDEDGDVSRAAAHALALYPGVAERLAGRVLGSAAARLCLLRMGARARPAAARLGRMLETAKGHDAGLLIDLLTRLGPFAEDAAPSLATVAPREPGAFRALGAIGGAAAAALLGLLEEPATRRAAARALAAMGREAAPAVPMLLRFSAEAVDPFAHGARLPPPGAPPLDPLQQALAAAGPAAVPGLVRQLDGDAPGRALLVLSTLGPAAAPAVPAARQLLETLDKRAGVLAAWALARLDPRHERTRALLRQALHAGAAAPPLRVAAFQALHRLAAVRPQDRDALLALARGRAAPGLRARAVRLLAWGPPRDLGALSRDASGDVRRAVAFARCRWHGRSAADALLAGEDRARVMHDLGALGRTEDWIVAALDAGWRSDDPAVRRAAARQRLRLRPQDAAFALAALADPATAAAAREVLAAFGPAAKPALLAAAVSDDPAARTAAVDVWRRRPPLDLEEARAALPLAPRAVPRRLAERVADETWTALARSDAPDRRAAAYWARRLGRHPVERFLRDPALAVRLAALR